MVLCLLNSHVLGHLLFGSLSFVDCQGHGTLGLLGELIWYFGAISTNKLPFRNLGLKERTSDGVLSLEGSCKLCYGVQDLPFAFTRQAKLDFIEVISALDVGLFGPLGHLVLLVCPLDFIR